MKRRPLSDYPEPRYPQRGAEGDSVRELLPERWRRKTVVAAAAALFFFPVTPACASGTSTVADSNASSADKKKKQPALPSLAQVFEHGEGRGAFGCVAVAPPAFLSEHDARQVILEEFAKAGVKFGDEKHAVPGLAQQGKPTDLVLDGYDPVHKIGFEYVSDEKYFALGGVQSGSTVQDYDFKSVAQSLVKRTAGDHTAVIGVLYDPMGSMPRSEWSKPTPRNKDGEDQLRAQVRDFIAWLKAQGVLEP